MGLEMPLDRGQMAVAGFVQGGATALLPFPESLGTGQSLKRSAPRMAEQFHPGPEIIDHPGFRRGTRVFGQRPIQQPCPQKWSGWD
jgi:hypothetical protein